MPNYEEMYEELVKENRMNEETIFLLAQRIDDLEEQLEAYKRQEEPWELPFSEASKFDDPDDHYWGAR